MKKKNGSKFLGYIISEQSAINEKPLIRMNNSNGVRIHAVLQEADLTNRNNRMYPSTVLKAAISEPLVQERLVKKNLFGEAGHPIDPTPSRQMNIDQTRMSHRIDKLWWEGSNLLGEVSSAATCIGEDFANIIRSGSEVGFSMRGISKLMEERNGIVHIKQLFIQTWDWVLFPSNSGAYLKSVLSESNNYGNLQQIKSVSEDICIPIYKEATEYVMGTSKNYKALASNINIEGTNITISEDLTKLFIKGKEDKIVMYLEDYIVKECRDTILTL